jgi:hypothetical protein
MNVSRVTNARNANHAKSEKRAEVLKLLEFAQTA